MVTTVLIILVVLAGIVIIWTFISRFLDKAGEQIETDSLTVSMSILPESLFVDNVITNDPRPAGMIVRRNAGVGNPAGFVLSFEDETKKIVMYTIEFSELNPPRVMNEFDTMPVSISNFGNRGLLKVVKVGVAPFFRRGASVIIGTYSSIFVASPLVVGVVLRVVEAVAVIMVVVRREVLVCVAHPLSFVQQVVRRCALSQVMLVRRVVMQIVLLGIRARPWNLVVIVLFS